jgi:hypothetical protein
MFADDTCKWDRSIIYRVVFITFLNAGQTLAYLQSSGISFTQATDDPIPNKGQSQHPQMPDIIITENGINKLLQNINIHKASVLNERY